MPVAPLLALWRQWYSGLPGPVVQAPMSLGQPSDPVDIPYTWISPPINRRPTTAITKAQISQTNGATATASAAAAAVGQYGVNTASAQLDTAVDADAQNMAAFLTTWESTPRPRQPIVRLILLKRTDDECLKVLGVTLGTRVRVTGAPETWPAGVITFVVEGIRQVISNDYRGVEWMTSAPVGTSHVAGVSLPGTAGNYTSTPDAGVLDVAGDIDLRADAELAAWTGSNQALVAKWTTSGNQRSYRLLVQSGGLIDLSWSAAGIAVLSAVSTVAPTVSAGQRLAVRATLDVDNGAAGNTARFYTAPSINGPWTQLGAAVTAAGVTSIFNGTSTLEVGTQAGGTANFATGVIYAAEVRDGSTVVANPYFGAQSLGTTSFTDDAGRAWTLNGTAQIVAATVVPGPWFRWDNSYWSGPDTRPF